jgi:hypothetical protein
MQTDFLQFMYQAINDLLTQNLGFFDAMGQNLFRMFATILIAWYGVKSALSAASGKYTFQFDNFASLLLTIAFGFAMVNYYSTPIPGIGTSFHNLITDEAQFLANKINQTELQTIVDRIGDFEARIDAPGVTDFLGMAIYIIVIILLAAAQAISIVLLPMDSSRRPFVCLSAPSSCRSLSSRSSNGSSGAGSVVSCSTPSMRSSPPRSSTSSATLLLVC